MLVQYLDMLNHNVEVITFFTNANLSFARACLPYNKADSFVQRFLMSC